MASAAPAPDSPGAAWFRSSVERGIEAERVIAIALLDEGLGVRHPVPEFVEGIAAGTFPADEPDVSTSANLRLWFGIEVKKKTKVVFTGRDDFPYSSVYVGDLARWETRVDSPDYVVVYSEITGGRFVVPAYTRSLWRPVEPWPSASPILAAPRDCFKDVGVDGTTPARLITSGKALRTLM